MVTVPVVSEPVADATICTPASIDMDSEALISPMHTSVPSSDVAAEHMLRAASASLMSDCWPPDAASSADSSALARPPKKEPNGLSASAKGALCRRTVGAQ